MHIAFFNILLSVDVGFEDQWIDNSNMADRDPTLRVADNSYVILPLRTEGVVIMTWPITDHSSAARVPDNDHPAL
jgi:hypothetical protein